MLLLAGCFGGTVSGYASGGDPVANSNIIDKFSFAADGNATDVGDLTEGRYWGAGQSSATSGYTSGGRNPPVGYVNTIDKFSFAADGNASDVGDLTENRNNGAAAIKRNFWVYIGWAKSCAFAQH